MIKIQTKNHKIIYLLMLVITILLIRSLKPTNIEEWDGFFSYKNDICTFEPCGLQNKEFWNIYGNNKIISKLISMYKEIVSIDNGIYVRLNGKISEMDSSNNVHKFNRKFKLYEILEVRIRTENDCKCDCE